jgi:polar amino acid transport system substrate-binding protein
VRTGGRRLCAGRIARRRATRLAWLVAIIAAFGLVASACGDDDSSSRSGDAPFQTIADGTLTACSDISFEPFEFFDGDTPTGFDMELGGAIADNLDLEFAVTDQDFDGIWLAPAADRCDVAISAIPITPERQETALFSDPYFAANQSLLVRAGEADQYPDLAATEGKTIGVQTGTTGAAYAKATKPAGARIKEFDAPAAMFVALQSNDIDAVLQGFPMNLERANQDDRFAVAAEFETGEQYGIATSKDRTALMNAINAELRELRDDGSYQEILDEWFPRDEG